jgi:hypothetical protein
MSHEPTLAAGLDNTGSDMQEELCGPGLSLNRWKVETAATRAVTGRDLALFGMCPWYCTDQ